MTRSEIPSTNRKTFFLCILCFLSLWIQFCVQGKAYAGGGVMPHLSTGAVSYSIPIEVPAGRRGMAPALALTYGGGGDGSVGVGWELETGSIERNTRNGLYDERDTYVLRMGGTAIELVNISGNEYRAKIEGSFFKVTRVPGAGGDDKDYWIAKDKTGTQYEFGYPSANRQFDEADPSRIFKWCLDQVTDTNGNYMIFTYSKDNGQIYIDHIDYTGNIGDTPTKSVKFYRDSGIDSPEKYDTKFKVKTTKRLKTVAVYADSQLVTAYAISYRTSPDTNRSLLTSVQRFGSDATLDDRPESFGTVLGGTAFPATTFEWTTNEPKGNFGWAVYSRSGPAASVLVSDQCLMGDLDGDGKNDFWCESAQGSGTWDVALSNGSGWTTSQWYDGPARSVGKCLTGDLDGDGRTDFWCESAQGSGTWDVALSTGSGWTTSQWNNGPVISAWPPYKPREQCFTGDIDGDGKTDFWCETGSGTGIWKMALSTGSSWNTTQQDTSANGPKPVFPINDHCFTGDLDADGKTDFWCEAGSGSWRIALSTDAGWTTSQWDNGPSPGSPVGNTCLTGDLNADGKTDLWCETTVGSTTWRVALSTGDRWATSAVTGPAISSSVGGQCMLGDLNGDGKTDFWCQSEQYPGVWTVNLAKGYGQNFWDTRQWFGTLEFPGQCFSGDLNGDGMTDMWCGGSDGVWNLALSSGNSIPDLLASAKNGIGGTTTISYAPSTIYPDTRIPFPVYTVSSITTNDGNGLSSTTNYDYAGGYYHIGERDLRGFNRVTVTGPEDPNHVRIIAETWFHRGNDTRTVTDIFTPQAYIDDPTGKDGYMRGRPYFTRVMDSMGQLHSVSTTVYYPAESETPPYFTPDRETNSYSCDNGTCETHIRTVNTYDNTYGNLLRTDDYGDVDDPNDDRTMVRTYAVNASAWIVGLPSSETVYKGIGTADADKISKTTYYYDGVPPIGASCGSGSFSGKEIPDRGLVTRVVRWLDKPIDTNIEERMAYDSYGNLSCSWNAEGNPPLFFSYDETHTYRRFATNPLRHKMETRYYGVDNESTANGVYGQVKSAIDPNGSTVESYFDPLGRKIATFFWPEGTWISWTYPEIASLTGNTYGVVGAQHVMTDNVTGNKTWTYSDGLGRTILEKKTGPNNRIVESRTLYNANGSVKEKTMPVFAGASDIYKSTFTYDALGRTTDVTNPDGTTAHMCYRGNITVGINADKHRKRATRDARGRLVKAEEYLGTYNGCSTEEGTPYATTVYEYNLKGELLKVIDTSANETRMEYDSLGRKIAMHDPDTGDWKYEYDRNGNLTKQTDANNNTISLTYDALGRVTLKDYATGTDVQFRYDEQTSTYSIGGLTSMIDASGTTTFNYDYMGRPVTITKYIDGSYYTITNGYENARLTSVTYPDGEIVRYSYGTGSELNAVYTVLPGGGTYMYAMYPAAEYTALSQPKKVYYGNGVETTYKYYAENNRPQSILTTRSGVTEPLLDLAYEYTEGGNIKSIADPVTPSITSPGMTVSYTYAPNDKPHAVRSSSDGGSYSYDNNGNMTSDGVRTFTYDYDNRLQSVITSQGTTTFVYDGTGTRVKKIGLDGEYIYIGKYYQCKDGTCIKYIYGGDTLIADQIGTDIEYYHQDHLGSTRVVTNDISEDKGWLSYYPFGETLTVSGALGGVDRKYTSQELDSETGLYFYNARYYNPILGRFISADTIVPEPGNSQSLNRYSYVYNNPLNFVDPTGHWQINISAHCWVGFHFSWDSHTHDYQLGLGIGQGYSLGFGKYTTEHEWYVDYTTDTRVDGSFYVASSRGSSSYGNLKVGYGASVQYYHGEIGYQWYVGAGYGGSKGSVGLNVAYSKLLDSSNGKLTVNGSATWTDTVDSLKNNFSANYDFGSGEWTRFKWTPTVDGWGASYDFVSGNLSPKYNKEQVENWARPLANWAISLIPDWVMQLVPDKTLKKLDKWRGADPATGPTENAMRTDMISEQIWQEYLRSMGSAQELL